MKVVKVADIKSGQFYLGDPGKLRQLLGQGFACWARAREQGLDVQGFVPGVYYARLGMFDWGQPIIEGTTAWAEAWRWVMEAARRDREPHPGPWCLGCWDKKDCAKNPEAA